MSKENLHFDDQSIEVAFPFFLTRCFLKEMRKRVIETLLKVWENLKRLWKHSLTARVLTAFLVLLNFQSCFYLTINFILEKLIRRLTFNPGLALTGFLTTCTWRQATGLVVSTDWAKAEGVWVNLLSNMVSWEGN